MHVTLDEPTVGGEIQSRFRVRGWAWLAGAHPHVRRVEIWHGELKLGESSTMHHRPDVNRALKLAEDTCTGFDFYVVCDGRASARVDLQLRCRMADGSAMGPFCHTNVRFAEKSPTAERTSRERQFVLDSPGEGQRINPADFRVSGWVWEDAGQRDIVAVEAWTGDELLGRCTELTVRTDVSDALRLASGIPTAFEIKGCSAKVPDGEARIDFRVRYRDDSVATCGAVTVVFDAACEGVATVPTKELQAAHQYIGFLQKEVRELRLALAKATDPFPPEHLQIRQTAVALGSLFYESGEKIARSIEEAFAAAGTPLTTASRVLDFGCGCGRVLHALRQVNPAGEIWGSDIDPEAIAWNRKHIGEFGQFVVNRTEPPLPFPDSYFDAVFSVSVFTHLPEDMQLAWLDELNRVLGPNGTAVISVHGEKYWRTVHPDVCAKVARDGFDYRTAQVTEGLPEFYMVAFHSTEYVQRVWGRIFEVCSVKPAFIGGTHDAVIVRSRKTQ